MHFAALQLQAFLFWDFIINNKFVALEYARMSFSVHRMNEDFTDLSFQNLLN